MTNEELLAGTLLFRDMKKRDLKRIAKIAVRRSFKPGQVIVEEGQFRVFSPELESFYIVVSGQVEVVKGLGRKNEVVLAALGPREFFGEMALFSNFRRSASVVAKQDTECLVLDRRGLYAEVRNNPELAFYMLGVVSRRLIAVEKAMAE